MPYFQPNQLHQALFLSQFQSLRERCVRIYTLLSQPQTLNTRMLGSVLQMCYATSDGIRPITVEDFIETAEYLSVSLANSNTGSPREVIAKCREYIEQHPILTTLNLSVVASYIILAIKRFESCSVYEKIENLTNNYELQLFMHTIAPTATIMAQIKTLIGESLTPEACLNVAAHIAVVDACVNQRSYEVFYNISLVLLRQTYADQQTDISVARQQLLSALEIETGPIATAVAFKQALICYGILKGWQSE